VCDCYAGSVLISVHRGDDFAPRAIEESFGHDRISTLDDAAGRDLSGLGLDHRYYQVDVPAGDEQARADRFRRDYADVLLRSNPGPAMLRQCLLDADFTPIAQPEALATTSAQPAAGPAAPFAFTPEHQRYRQLLSMPPGTAGSPAVTVGVIDSGWQAPAGLSPSVISEADLTTSPVGSTATDVCGHGSVVLAIIDDLAPGTQFRVYKVGDSSCREWTLLAGLASAADDRCDIVNASTGFGLKDRNCAVCGRDYGTTRSQVFHRLLAGLLDGNDDLAYVGAAGNQGASRACYPARFSPAICVASTDGQGALSTFSNRGNYDQDDAPHPCLILAPGGNRLQAGAGADEYVAANQGTDWRGTSFSAAYVTGLLAHRLAQSGSMTRTALISGLIGAASAGRVQAYAQSDHGAGLAQHF
jgi:hypothetical protein